MKKIVLITALLFSACLVVMPFNSFAKSAEKVYATIGQEKITQADIDSKISMLPPQFRARYETAEGKKKLVEQLTKFSLLSQEARRLKLDKKDEVSKRIKEISDNIIIQELIKQEIMEKIKVNDADSEKYYKEHKDEFVDPEKVKVNLIMFKLKEDATPEVKKEQKKKAELALKRVKKGEDFEKVAKEVSEDERTNKSGGNTGFFSKGKRAVTYGPAFEEKAFALKAGEISSVIEEKNGYYIIKVGEKKAQKEETFQESKSKIERKMQQDQQKKAYDDYIESLKKRYPIKIHEENIGADAPKPAAPVPAVPKPAQP